MDPNEALRNARHAIDLLWLQHDRDANYNGHDVVQLAEAFTALDGWLRRGGALPKAWDVN